MAARYHNQIGHGNDSEIANATTQFNMARETLAASYGGAFVLTADLFGYTLGIDYMALSSILRPDSYYGRLESLEQHPDGVALEYQRG